MAVLLHGLSANHTTWLRLADDLHKAECNTLAVDLRGHGDSDKSKIWSNYALPQFTEDLRLIVEEEKLEKVFLAGYSFGGFVALDYARTYPEKTLGMVLVSTELGNPLIYRHLNFLTPLGYAVLWLLAILLKWQKRKEYIYYRHGASRGYWHSVWIGLNTMPLTVNLWLLMQYAHIDLRGKLGGIKVPAVIVRGKQDPFVTQQEAEDMCKMIAGSRLIVSEKLGHFVASRSQDEVAGIILDAIKRI